ncbi:MAG: GNAT family N-acetyltransferase [Bdellovibrionota bacterium]
MSSLTWQWSSFSELSNEDLYETLKLRQRVFIVEQNCAYLDCDGLDQKSFHLIGRDGRALLAYLRVLPAGLKYPEASLGRVVTAPEARGTGAGKALLYEALRQIDMQWGKIPLRISAQAYLQKFYEDFGFRVEGAPYLEDNIPHIEMLLTNA